MKLTAAQKNILDITVRATLITRGKNKGQVKDVIQADSFDFRSFGPLIQKKLVTWHEGTCGCGYVATINAFSALEEHLEHKK